ncbi:MAG: right-handed parallel beta-helix repeat-containing protein [Pseudomonadota bacterium]
MKKIKAIIVLVIILLSNIAFAQVLESFEKPQLYTEPTVQLPRSIPMQEKDLFTIPNTNVEIDLNQICVDAKNPIYITKAQNVIDAFNNYTKYLEAGGKYYELCFVMENALGDQMFIEKSIEMKIPNHVSIPMIISGLVFDQPNTGMKIDHDGYLIVHNFEVKNQTRGIELTCRDAGCLLVNSNLSGITSGDISKPGFCIKTTKDSRNVIIKKSTIISCDIGIDAEGENILVEKSSITKNKMYGIRADSSVKDLSLSNMVSLSDNGDGIKALDAFMLEEGANSNIGLIKTLADKETFVVPESTLNDTTARYVEFYKPKTEKNLQPIEFIYRYELKPTELIKKKDSITVTDPRIQGQYAMAVLKTADGSTISPEALLIKDRVIVLVGGSTTIDSPSGFQSGGENVGGGGDELSGGAFGDGSGGGFAAAGKTSCSLSKGNDEANGVVYIMMFFLSGLLFFRRVHLGR